MSKYLYCFFKYNTVSCIVVSIQYNSPHQLAGAAENTVHLQRIVFFEKIPYFKYTYCVFFKYNAHCTCLGKTSTISPYLFSLEKY